MSLFEIRMIQTNFFLASCAIERIQRARFDKYKLFLQKLGAKRIFKKIDKMESSEENDKVDVKLKSDNRGAQKTTEKNDNKTSKGAVDINIVKEIKEVFKENYWEDLSFCSENDGSVFTREQWENAKNFLMQNNLQFDDDFLTMLEFRNPSTNMNLLKRFANHYHCKKDMSTIFDLGVSVDIAKIALGFNPATKILSSFLKLSVNIDFHYRKEITRIAEQSIDVEVEF